MVTCFAQSCIESLKWKNSVCKYGNVEGSSGSQLMSKTKKYPNIKLCRAKLLDPFGTHHTKMMLLRYENGLRVVIHTANLIEGDWHQKTQAVYISPLFPASNKAYVDSSSTKFQSDLLEYLESYHSSEIDYWCQLIKKYDMSEAKVFIVASSPGRRTEEKRNIYGHLKLRKILSFAGPSSDMVDSTWPVVAQFSSIGSLGPTQHTWLCKEFLGSLSETKTDGPKKSKDTKLAPVKLIFPSVEDVRNSLEGYAAGASIPFSIRIYKKQEYLKLLMHRWISERNGRSHASPHIKSYLRISPDMKKIAWFHLTSANLSKAAWGGLEKNGSQLAIRSYEMGVLFLPKFFGDYDYFEVPESLAISGDGKSKPYSFPTPFDVPLTPYSKEDSPWIWDVGHTHLPDTLGNMWTPP